ncbi:MAG: hypothetical protein ACKOQ3_09165 [Novosphingobium sp.]
MKKTALVAALALASLGLAGCQNKAEEAAETATEAAAEASDAAATASDAAATASDAAVEAADAATDGQGSGVTRPPAP